MKYIATSNLLLIGSSLGRPDSMLLPKVEKQAWETTVAAQTGWIPAAQDIRALSDATATSFTTLWNWPSSPFGQVRADPFPGLLVTISASDITKVVGANLGFEWSFASQVFHSYTSPGADNAVKHSAIFEISRGQPGPMRVAIIPAQVVGGRTILAMPHIDRGVYDTNYLKVTGLTSGMTANMRALSRHDPALLEMFPDLAVSLFEVAT